MDGIGRSGAASPALSHYDRSEQRTTGLVKQTYSAWVLADPQRPQRWHLTAYLTFADLPHLPTPDQDTTLRSVVAPPGMYRSGKTRSRNSDAGISSAAPSPPASPSPYGRSAYPNPPASRPGESLPSLHTAIAPSHHDGHGVRRHHDSRAPEDQRMIQMLNSRHIM